MKDILISSRRIGREISIFIACVVIALGVNVFAIVKYKTEWKELGTTWLITLALAVILYLVLGVVRVVICGVGRLFGRRVG